MRSYKESMDKIAMPDALKERIRTQAAQQRRPPAVSRLRARRFLLPAANIAACLLLLLCTQMRLTDYLIPVQDAARHAETLPSAPTSTPPPETGIPAKDAMIAPAMAAAPDIAPSAVPTQPQDGEAEPLPQPEAQTQKTAPAEDSSGSSVRSNVTTLTGGTVEPDEMPRPAQSPPLQPTPPPHSAGGAAGGGSPSPGGGGGGGGLQQVKNPAQDFDSLDALRAACDFTFQMPYKLPEGCKLTDISLLEDSMVQLTYGGSCSFTFRAAPGNESVSGDYNTYEENYAQATGKGLATFRGRRGLVFTAEWQEDGVSYAIVSSGLPPALMRTLIAGMQ